MYTSLGTMIAVCFVLVTFSPDLQTESFAHIDGCHRWHSCPSDDGSYVCGDLGYDDECGSSDDDKGDESNDDDDTEQSNTDIDSGDDNSDGNEVDTNDWEQITSTDCQGQADCFRGRITDIVDGDTLDVDNVRIRLSLVNTPERGESGYSEAKEFTGSVCSIGSEALVDEDDEQKEGSFGRLIGLVYCENDRLLLNEELLNEGHAQILEDFCSRSEFSDDDWALKFGC